MAHLTVVHAPMARQLDHLTNGRSQMTTWTLPQGHPAGRQWVLIADDDEQERHTVRLVLESAGYAVQEAQDGMRTLYLLRTSPYPLIVLLEQLLPNLGGASLLQQAVQRAELSRHSYVILTPNTYTLPPLGLTQRLAQLGGLYLSKPVEAKALLQVVTQAARRLAAAQPRQADDWLNS
jgi:CheY-like chemotaxis protein